ncbi:MAG: hypothetical protein RIS36_1999 [Pseudomonadota bacterium]
MDREPLVTKSYESAIVQGREFAVVAPRHFYAAATSQRGLGLFAEVALEPGDIWWGNSFTDSRYVERVISWDEHMARPKEERRVDEITCFVDTTSKQLVICTEPFCRVNHGRRGVDANADGDEFGSSIISKLIPAGQEILIPYDYEAVISIVWKFPEFAQQLPQELRADEAFLFSNVKDCHLATAFLNSL